MPKAFGRDVTIVSPALEFIYPKPSAELSTVTITNAGRVFLIAVEVPFDCTVDGVAFNNGGTVNGSVRVAIYTDDGDEPDALVVESASTALSGTNVPQEISIADTELTKGLYWLAIQCDLVGGNTILIADDAMMFRGGTLKGYHFDNAGGYGAFDDPVGALTSEIQVPTLCLLVKSVP